MSPLLVNQEHTQLLVDLVMVLILVSPFVAFFFRLSWEMTGWLSEMADFYFDKLCDWIIKQFKRFLRRL